MWFSRTKYEGNLIVIYIGYSTGFVEDSHAIVREYLSSFETLDWRYQSPHSFFCYLSVNPENRKLAKSLLDKFRELRECESKIKEVRIGLEEGNVMGEFNRKGDLNPSSTPMGDVISRSMTNAI